MLIDSHCHLIFDAFADDLPDVLARAAQAGVSAFINPGTNLGDSRQIVTMSDAVENLYAAVGVHPNDAAGFGPAALEQLRELAAHPNVVAIGEIGLDYYWDKTPRPVQQRAFEQQLALAVELDLPVIIHQRDSAADTMAILRDWGAGGNHPGLVLHSFSGDVPMAEEAVSLGFYIGISGPVTFKNSRALPDVVAAVPPDRLLVETDAPFLSPHPFRGKRNEPARVQIIAKKMAELRGLSPESMAQHLTANTVRLFGLSLQS
ncbi:MAG: TatD family deoxyribonuclease [Chloroflexi bacterium]|nr:MAG: TatD family deoxyribonuclease [Chloroflexota bacterium]